MSKYKMNKKFTKGPWRVEHSNSQMSFNDTTVCVISYNEIINGFHMVASPANKHGDEAATARLIAAAPEMFDLIERIEKVHPNDVDLWKRDARKLLNKINNTETTLEKPVK